MSPSPAAQAQNTGTDLGLHEESYIRLHHGSQRPPICVHCEAPVDALYTRYASSNSIRTNPCVRDPTTPKRDLILFSMHVVKASQTLIWRVPMSLSCLT